MEIVVAEVGAQPDGDQIYRITFDGSVTDEPGFVAFGGQADQVAAALKEHYSEGMSLSEAFAAALTALSAPGNGERTEFGASQLEVAILERARDHRTFRRIRAARLEELIAEARPAPSDSAPGGPVADPRSRSQASTLHRRYSIPSRPPARRASSPGSPRPQPHPPGSRPRDGPGPVSQL